MAGKVIKKLAKDQKRQDKLMQAALNSAKEFHIDIVGKQWIEFFNHKFKNRNT